MVHPCKSIKNDAYSLSGPLFSSGGFVVWKLDTVLLKKEKIAYTIVYSFPLGYHPRIGVEGIH